MKKAMMPTDRIRAARDGSLARGSREDGQKSYLHSRFDPAGEGQRLAQSIGDPAKSWCYWIWIGICFPAAFCKVIRLCGFWRLNPILIYWMRAEKNGCFFRGGVVWAGASRWIFIER